MNQTHSPSIKLLTIEKQNIGVQALWVIGFAGLTAVGAQIELPHHPVPYTLQTLFVLLAGALLGKEKGAMSQLLYLGVGALGLPVFSGMGFGIARLFGPTGGYLLSFPVAAFVVGYLLRQNKSFLWTLIAMTLGLLVVFSLGTVQLYVLYFHDWAQAFSSGFLIFSWWDAVKLFAAASIYQRIAQYRSA